MVFHKVRKTLTDALDGDLFRLGAIVYASILVALEEAYASDFLDDSSAASTPFSNAVFLKNGNIESMVMGR